MRDDEVREARDQLRDEFRGPPNHVDGGVYVLGEAPISMEELVVDRDELGEEHEANSDDNSHFIASFDWFSVGPMSFNANLTLVEEGDEGLLCYWDEVDSLRALARLVPAYNPAAVGAVFRRFVAGDGPFANDRPFEMLPSSTWRSLRASPTPTLARGAPGGRRAQSSCSRSASSVVFSEKKRMANPLARRRDTRRWDVSLACRLSLVRVAESTRLRARRRLGCRTACTP